MSYQIFPACMKPCLDVLKPVECCFFLFFFPNKLCLSLWPLSSSIFALIFQVVLGDYPIEVTCPRGHVVMTRVRRKPGLLTYMFAILLGFLGGPLCAAIPFCCDCTYDMVHYCPVHASPSVSARGRVHVERLTQLHFQPYLIDDLFKRMYFYKVNPFLLKHNVHTCRIPVAVIDSYKVIIIIIYEMITTVVYFRGNRVLNSKFAETYMVCFKLRMISQIHA